jgi:hypothetical protein
MTPLKALVAIIISAPFVTPTWTRRFHLMRQAMLKERTTILADPPQSETDLCEIEDAWKTGNLYGTDDTSEIQAHLGEKRMAGHSFLLPNCRNT